MMLDIITKKNPKLVQISAELHQNGSIPPDTYVVDLDGVRENARNIKQCGDANGIRLYAMSKQINRNPSMLKVISEEGIKKAVAVDIQDFNMLTMQKFPIGHVGHLAQIPRHSTERVLKAKPEIWTVYDYERAVFISQAAKKLGVQQDIVMKVIGPNDKAYIAQEGGIPLTHAMDVAKRIMDLPNVRIVGTTGFPCVMYDENERKLLPAPNIKTIADFAARLNKELGIEISHINCPGTSSCKSIEIVKQHGGTDAEPGSAFWGTAMQQLFGPDNGVPSVTYVTEVSHFAYDVACVLGGGFAPDVAFGDMAIKDAFVGSNPDTIMENRVKAEDPNVKMDYYAWLMPDPSQSVKPGDSAVYFFRPQVFSTRSSNMAAVSGLQSGKPKLESVIDRGGRQVA
ncbi:MAG: alanine racemase [Chloroflexi bacterium]|nr:alanine racemase [Chloroflexota bacterium]